MCVSQEEGFLWLFWKHRERPFSLTLTVCMCVCACARVRERECVCAQVSAVSTLRCRCKMLPPWRDPGCCTAFCLPLKQFFCCCFFLARDTRINSAGGFPCVHSACSANTTSTVILQRRCLSLSVSLCALFSPLRSQRDAPLVRWDTLLRFFFPLSLRVCLSQLRSFSLFCPSKGTCCVEVTLSRPQLQRGERKEVERARERERQNTFPGGGEKQGGKGVGEGASVLQLSWMHNFSLFLSSCFPLPFFFFTSLTSLSAFHIVSCTDILFSRAVFCFGSQKKPPVSVFFKKPIMAPCSSTSPKFEVNGDEKWSGEERGGDALQYGM